MQPRPSDTAATGELEVIFIAGAGRSGSTLLDRLVGTSPGVLSLGELRSFWRGFVEGQDCACGSPIRQCPFWGEVIVRAFGGLNEEAAAEVWRTQHRLHRLRFLPLLLLPTRKRLLSPEFREAQRRLLAAVAAVADACVLVDSTKQTNRAAVLAALPGIRLHVIHLVRDSRAVAYSWTRGEVRGRPMPRRGSLWSAAYWLQGCLAPVLAFRAQSFRRVRYEDLAARPKETMDALTRGLGLGPTALEAGGEAHLPAGHQVGGNPMRFQHGRIRVVEDEEWREKMPLRDRLLVTLLTWPLLLAYGYPLWPGKRWRRLQGASETV